MSTQSSPASAAAQFTYPAAAAAAATGPSYFPVPFHLQNAQYAAWPAGAAAAAPTVPAYNAIYPMPQIQQVYNTTIRELHLTIRVSRAMFLVIYLGICGSKGDCGFADGRWEQNNLARRVRSVSAGWGEKSTLCSFVYS